MKKFLLGTCMTTLAVLSMFTLKFSNGSYAQDENRGDVIQISSGNTFNLALLVDGTVWSWGDNTFGQLANGTSGNGIFAQNYRAKPQRVSGLTEVISISAGPDFSVALKRDGSVWTWGHGHMGQIGNGEAFSIKGIEGLNYDKVTPTKVTGLSHVVAVSAGGNHVLALKEDGTVWAWGQNYSGQLGIDDPNVFINNNPSQVKGIDGITQISAGSLYNVALKKDGTVWAWGLNSSGSIGVGSTDNLKIFYSPVKVKNFSNSIRSIESLGRDSNLAITEGNGLWQWGSDIFNLTAGFTSTPNFTPVKVSIVSGVKSILLSAQRENEDHSIEILKEDGTVWGNGKNSLGQLGDGTNTDKSEFTQNKDLHNIIQISGNSYYYDGTHTVALDQNGNVWAWGFNQVGQVGPGGWSFNEPQRVDIPEVLKVKLNDQYLSFDEYPEIINNKTMIPFRKIFESLGATVKWDDATQTIIATKGNKEMKLIINQDTAYINKDAIILEQAPVIKNDTTLVPLRFITESFGGSVKWDEDTRTVELTVR